MAAAAPARPDRRACSKAKDLREKSNKLNPEPKIEEESAVPPEPKRNAEMSTQTVPPEPQEEEPEGGGEGEEGEPGVQE